MIVVLGSRHDPAAIALTERWPHAALCSAEDLVAPGWVWRQGTASERTWVVDGKPVADAAVTGVFVRRSAVYAEELLATQPADRTFMAAECRALLVFVLATTAARVVNPVSDGAFGEEALRPERWLAPAAEAGIAIYPVRITDAGPSPPRAPALSIEVAVDEVFGDSPALHAPARRLARALSLTWCALLFDAEERLLAITTARAPGDDAATVLGRYLESRR